MVNNYVLVATSSSYCCRGSWQAAPDGPLWRRDRCKFKVIKTQWKPEKPSAGKALCRPLNCLHFHCRGERPPGRALSTETALETALRSPLQNIHTSPLTFLLINSLPPLCVLRPSLSSALGVGISCKGCRSPHTGLLTVDCLLLSRSHVRSHVPVILSPL